VSGVGSGQCVPKQLCGGGYFHSNNAGCAGQPNGIHWLVSVLCFWLSLIVEMNQLYSCVVDNGRKRSVLNTTQLYLEQQSSSSERKRAVTTLEVKVGSQWIQCPLAGGVVKVKTSEYAGELDCPSSETMCCTRLNNCHERGACVDGACVCHPGWEGRQCERAVEPRVRLASSRE
jgi:hypothetical protein